MCAGIIAGVTWAIETIILGIALAMTPFVSTEQAIFLAPFVSTFVHDAFSAIWSFIWNASRGNLWDVAPGKSIGGSRFGNYEGLLPEARNRKYTECDIDYDGGYRNSKRIIFSNDGLIFYTEDHYRTFEQLY